MWNILVISLLSGLSTPLGAFIMLHFRWVSRVVLAFVLALASGVMMTVVITDLMPASVRTGGGLWFVGGFACGWVVMLILQRVMTGVEAVKGSADSNHMLQIGGFIALAIALHDLPEGMAIGAGDVVHVRLGMMIALAIALHNIPEGMSIAAPLYMGGMRRRRIMWMTVLIGFVTPFGTAISVLLGSISNTLNAFILALASGTMSRVVAHDIYPEAWQAGKLPAVAGALSGVALMLMVSPWLH